MSEKIRLYPHKKHLILCEGMDEKFFFMWFLDYYKKKGGYDKYNEIQLEDVGRISDICQALNVWKKASGFSELKTIGIIRDAEKDADSAVNSVRDSFSKNGFQEPSDCFELADSGNIKTIFGILPGTKTDGKWDNGTLEDLCLKILNDEYSVEKMECIDGFLERMQTDFDNEIRHRHKARLHTYFSSNEKFIGSKIGEAAKIGAFDFESKVLDGFRKMFDDMVNDTAE